MLYWSHWFRQLDILDVHRCRMSPINHKGAVEQFYEPTVYVVVVLEVAAMDTIHPNHSMISSNDVEGTAVHDLQGRNIGSIDHLMIDKISGRVLYGVLSFGGFLGLGHSHYPIPWEVLSWDKSLGGFRTDITVEQLKDAPQFSDDSWGDRNWEKSLHSYYDVPPYWM